jgi:hypothetical protein
MKFTPQKILKEFGLDVPEDGIEIGENDVYIYTTLLNLLGKSINVDNIPAEELKALLISMYGTLGRNPKVQETDDHLARLRSGLRLVQLDFGMKVE